LAARVFVGAKGSSNLPPRLSTAWGGSLAALESLNATLSIDPSSEYLNEIYPRAPMRAFAVLHVNISSRFIPKVLFRRQ
jgi:hypothetical protein